MAEILYFAIREEFRNWLSNHCLSNDGVWILFEKCRENHFMKAHEALEEALCFGWIDGQIQSIDASLYKKYFSMRRSNSKWSEKNKALTESLEERGLMTDYGRRKIEEAKSNGQWDAPKVMEITNEHILELSTLLKQYSPAYENF